ncbi:hypothetical protein EV1_025483 [Malus domestica]
MEGLRKLAGEIPKLSSTSLDIHRGMKVQNRLRSRRRKFASTLAMPLGPPPSMTPDSLKGYVYDTQSMSWGTFRSPKSSKPIGTMIAAYGKLYYLASPACLVYEMPSPPLERYDPGADR